MPIGMSKQAWFNNESRIPWTPAEENYVWDWYDASAISGLSNGDQVDSWSNLISEGRPLDRNSAPGPAAPGATGFPKYTTNVLNSLPGVLMYDTSTSTGSVINHITYGTHAYSNAGTNVVFVVATPTQTSGVGGFVLRSGHFTLETNRTAGKMSVAYWNGSFGTAQYGTSTLSANQPILGCGFWDVANQTRYLRMNGATESTVGSLGTWTYNISSAFVVGGNAYGQWNRSYIHEIIVVNQSMSFSEIEKVEGYLAHKWGIESYLSSSHPYKNSAP